MSENLEKLNHPVEIGAGPGACPLRMYMIKRLYERYGKFLQKDYETIYDMVADEYKRLAADPVNTEKTLQQVYEMTIINLAEQFDKLWKQAHPNGERAPLPKTPCYW